MKKEVLEKKKRKQSWRDTVKENGDLERAKQQGGW